jgi:hypothetical protein
MQMNGAKRVRSFDPITLRVLCQAFDSAIHKASEIPKVDAMDASLLRAKVARRIIEAATHGERDISRLREVGLHELRSGAQSKAGGTPASGLRTAGSRRSV